MRRLLALAGLMALAGGAAGASFRDCETCPEMIAVPGGEFVMGAPAGEEEREQLAEEFRGRSRPPRRVRVAAFAAGKYEVTRGEYAAFAAASRRPAGTCFYWDGEEYRMDAARSWRDPGYPQDDRHPVVCVSWEDASAYVAWLARKTGAPYRLLTEAEWEYAARAGTATARFWGDASERGCAYANAADATASRVIPQAIDWPVASCDDGHAHTAPVGSYRANAFGMHDMLGNAWEWTQDCWHANYEGAPVDARAWGGGDCYMRAVRGGSWDDVPAGVRAAYRVGSPMPVRVYGRGFRVAR